MRHCLNVLQGYRGLRIRPAGTDLGRAICAGTLDGPVGTAMVLAMRLDQAPGSSLTTLLAWVLCCTTVAALPGQRLQPVPQPKENPTTAEKAILGKFLFWDEQLSSDNSMACGTCHRPAYGGSDPRFRRHPGPDHKLLTADDGFGSPGIAPKNQGTGKDDGSLLDALFDRQSSVTNRLAPSNLTAQFAEDLFWDGRARGEFRDPLTGEVKIAAGGALESQALVPIMGTTEMAHEGRTWADVVDKLGEARPLHLATKLPKDLARAVAENKTYPKLFAAAFGDPQITPTRIAFAIAAYERTLFPDQTPYDKFVAGDRTALNANQRQGLRYLRQFGCTQCHKPPVFTDHSFRNLSVRPHGEDPGREKVTGKRSDRAKFKVPSLRNVGLRPRFLHNGQASSLPEVMRLYRWPRRDPDIDPLLRRGRTVDTQSTRSPMNDFLIHSLTDPRVKNETYPFDRPVLRSERTSTGK